MCGGWQWIWLLIVSHSADLSCYQLMARSHVCFYMRINKYFFIKSLISTAVGSGPLRAEPRRRGARRQICTTPGLQGLVTKIVARLIFTNCICITFIWYTFCTITVFPWTILKFTILVTLNGEGRPGKWFLLAIITLILYCVQKRLSCAVLWPFFQTMDYTLKIVQGWRTVAD